MDTFCIHLVYIYCYFYYPVATIRQPLGNHLATKRQPKTLGLISRDRIGPLAPVAKLPWKWYDFSINSGGGGGLR